MKTSYKYENFTVTIEGNLVTVTCEIDGKEYAREYDLDGDAYELPYKEIHISNEYVHFLDSNEATQFTLKFEYDSCLVIDDWRDIDNPISIGCHDFNDEVLVD